MGALISREPHKSCFQGPGLPRGVLWMPTVPLKLRSSKGNPPESSFGCRSQGSALVTVINLGQIYLHVQSNFYFFLDFLYWESFTMCVGSLDGLKWSSLWIFSNSSSFGLKYGFHPQASVRANIMFSTTLHQFKKVQRGCEQNTSSNATAWSSCSGSVFHLLPISMTSN